MGRPQRVAVIGVSHWHSIYDAAYLPLLADVGMQIVGVSDEDEAVVSKRAERFATTPYRDYRTMVERTSPDLVLALGRHVEMPAIFRDLVVTGIPFIMEKPWGVDDQTVRDLAALADARGAWVAAPFMTRYTHWAQAARKAVQTGELGAVSHVFFRMIRPTMQRYLEWDSPWMLSRAEAGGGALINLGSHGFDICRYITGEEPDVVSAVLSNTVHRSEVEDYAFVTLRTPSGVIFHNEVGYTMPTWPENSTDGERKVAAERGILRAVPEGIHILGPGRNETIPSPAGPWFYRGFLLDCLDRLERGEPPPVTAEDCARAVTLIHDAYRAAR